MVSAEQCKEDIAKKYLDQFKSELNFFEKAMILPISNKMKEILKSDKKIDAEKFSDLEDLGFRRKVLGVKFGNKELFEGLVNKTFKFLKEQQEKILEAQTQGKLEDLLASVINGKLDDLNQSVSQNGTPQANQGDNQQVQPPVGDNQGGASENQSSGGDNPDHQETSHEGDSNNHSIEAGVGAAVVGAGSYRAGVAQIESRLGLEHVDVPEHFDKDRTKKMLSGLADQMEDRMKGGLKLNKVQKYTYEKSIKNFRKAAESLDNQTAEAFKVWQKIGDKLPPQYLEHLNINHNVLSLIDALPDEELAKIIGKDEQAIVKFMEKKGITISTDFAKSLKLAKNVQEIKQITNVARNGRKLANFVKGVKGMGMITFLFMGFDVWNYFDASKEAELVKKLNEVRGEVLQDEATAQLLIGVGGVLAEALALRGVCAAGGSVAGPIGTAVGIIVGVIIGAASMLTSSYNSKKEFYAQNRHDFINKKRAEVKQSVVQLFESDRLGMDEGMKESIKDARGPNSEVNTMEDAWEALIYQEEVSEGGYNFLSWYYSSGDSEEDFLSKLSQEDKETYNQEKSQMEEIINIRMEYVKTHISTDQSSESYKALKKAIEDKKGLKYVEQILADSKLYQYLKSEDENPYIENYKQLDIAGYKEAYKNKLSSEYPQEFKIFEQLKEENPILLDEICRGTLASKNTIGSYIESSEQNSEEQESQEQLYTRSEIESLKKNIAFVEKYDKYRKLGATQEEDTSLSLTNSAIDFNYIEHVLIDFNNIAIRPKREQTESLQYLSSSDFNTRIDGRAGEVSKSTFQNILYRIAKEIHGYTGGNNKEDLVAFYALSGDVTGIYMNGKWKVNEDWEVDTTINDPDKITEETMLKIIVGEVELDSDVEVADEKLTEEFRERIKEIIKEEFKYKKEKEKYENKIIEYIKQQGATGYVELPNDLVLQGTKAGIGEVYNFLFTYENGEIKALGRGDNIENVLNFDKTNTKITYEMVNKLREEYTQEEKALLQKVDEIENKLLKIRGVEGDSLGGGTKEDELDIPVELERMMSKKSAEWHKAKESLLYMQPYTAQGFLEEKAKEYYEYFEGIYMGLLSEITRKNSFLNSNDVDEIDEFLQVSSFVGVNIVSVGKGELKFATAVDEAIAEYLLKLFDLYKDNATGKSIKELLLSEDQEQQKKGQEFAKQLYILCLEETVIQYDGSQSMEDFTTGDMNDTDFERVKSKMDQALSGKGFNEIYREYKESSVAQVGALSLRKVEKGESQVHEQVNKITDEIIQTLNDIDWAGKRKNPKFEAATEQPNEGEIKGTFNSWGYKEEITIYTKDGKLSGMKIDGLDQRYPYKENNLLNQSRNENDIKESVKEGLRTANLINFIKKNIEENPYGAGASGKRGNAKYGKYHWSNGGDLERDITNNFNDIDIVECETLEKYYPMIHKDEEFLDYINHLL